MTGIGFSLVATPFLVVASGSREGVREAILLSSVLNLAMLSGERRLVRARQAALLWVPAAVVTPAAAIVVRNTAPARLTVVAGTLTVVTAVALGAGRRVQLARGRAGALGAGLASGVMNVVAGIGGPVAALYALNAGWPPEATRATLQAYFLALNVVALASLGLPGLGVWQAVGLGAGWLAGTVLTRRVSQPAALWATLGLAGAGGAVAIARGLW